VAVSEEERVDKHGKKIHIEVPVEMPEGMTMGADKKDNAYGSAPSGAVRLAPAPKQMPIAPPMPEPADEKVADVPAPVVVVVSAQGLEPKGRTSLDQHLATITLPAGKPAELTLTLTVVRGKVDKVQVVKTTADAATVKAIVEALEAWKAPVWVDGQVQLVLKVRS
jgi:hypothetical protein